MFLGKLKACVYHMCYLRRRRGWGAVKGVLCWWKYLWPPGQSGPLCKWPPLPGACTCSPGRGIFILHEIALFACSLLWAMVHACKAADCGYFISEMCRPETPEFFLEYLKANYAPEPLRPVPSGISFECSYLETLCNLTQLSEKARNPKEQCSELGMKVGAGKDVSSPCPGTGSYFTATIPNSHSKEKC